MGTCDVVHDVEHEFLVERSNRGTNTFEASMQPVNTQQHFVHCGGNITKNDVVVHIVLVGQDKKYFMKSLVDMLASRYAGRYNFVHDVEHPLHF